MAANIYNLRIYSNDGSTLLDSIMVTDNSAKVTETGVDDPYGSYLYLEGKKFLGFAISANATEPTYAIGDIIAISSDTTLYIVEASVVTDLTNTTWYVPSGWSSSSAFGGFSINGTVNRNGSETEFFRFLIGYSFDGDYNNTANSVAFDSYGITVYNSTQDFSFSIIGGSDVTNTSLIQWLETYGIQLKVTDLTDTTWNVKAGWEAEAGHGRFSVDCSSDNLQGDEFGIGYSFNADSLDIVRQTNICSLYMSEFILQSYFNGENFSISFTGGTDVTNPKLIAWLSIYGEVQGGEEAPKYKQELLYLKSTGTQWIDTGLRLNQDSKLEMLISHFNTDNNRRTFGSRSSATQNNFSVVSGPVGGVMSIVADFDNYQNNRLAYVIDGDEYLEITISKQKLKINDVEKEVSTYGAFITPSNAYLFECSGSYPNGYVSAKMRLYYCRIYDNGVLVRDLIPVLDMNDVPCMYDKVSGELFYNAGTGDFAYEVKPEEPETKPTKKFTRLYLGAIAQTSNGKRFRKLQTTEYVEPSEPEEPVVLDGLFDENGVQIVSWDTLVNEYGLDVELDYQHSSSSADNYYTTAITSPLYILDNNEEFANVKQIVIPDSVTHIGNCAFYACGMNTNMSLTTGNGVTNIGEEAFGYIFSIAHIVIGSSVENVGDGAFGIALTTLHINSNKLLTLPTIDSAGTPSIYFNAYGEDTEVLFDVTTFLTKGSSKSTRTYNIYTNNTVLKNASLAFVDSYTIVNVYHLDGSEWEG